MNFNKGKLLFLILLTCSWVAQGKSFYVSTKGNDQNPGSKDRPFLTIERARDRAIQEIPYAKGDINIFLRGGSYGRSQAFLLKEEHSGTKDSKIVYRSYPGETARFFGGKRLLAKDFKNVSDQEVLNRIIDPKARSKVLIYDLDANGIKSYGKFSRRGFGMPTPTPPMLLYLNGERMTLSRYPNQGDKPLSMAKVIEKGPLLGDPDYHSKGGSFRYSDQRMSRWTEAEDAWLNGVISKDWAWTFNKIARVHPSSSKIELAYGERYGILHWKNDFFFVENLLEELDRAGEYYIDRKKGLLYLIPPPNFIDASVTVSSTTEDFIRLQGAKNIVIKNIIFDTSRGTAIEGFGENIKIDSCEFVRLGSSAIQLKGLGHHISSSKFHRIGGTAVALRGGEWETLTPSRSVVENCHFYNWGFWKRVYCPGVSLFGVGHVVRNSEFSHFPHNAIEIRGNDHLIEANLFHHGPNDFKDMGVIYGNLGKHPHHRGTTIRRNLFKDSASSLPKLHIIYPDNGTMGWNIEENIFFRTKGKAIGTNGGAYLNIINNLFIDCAITFDQSFFLATWNKNAKPSYEKKWKEIMAQYDFSSMPHGKKYPELIKLLDEDRIRPDSCRFERNLVWNPEIKREHPKSYQTRGGPMDLVKAKNNLISKGNPGFKDWKNLDFSLLKSSPIYASIPGFIPISPKKIGLIGPVGPRDE